MIVAHKSVNGIILTQGKIKYGRWIVGNAHYYQMVPDHSVIPLDKLTDRDREKIFKQARETYLERLEMQFAIHPELADKREEWIAAADEITFESVLREAEADAEHAKL